ncbi:uncharacterized protein LOC106133430 [Amyelois transitella]|uniref:uncharacterized protein LOC106133430 n=1 Tax=Amyelois transitella TaxID=680683 RepID=UPI00298F6D39|nr:uncharacterized protein LOC106133430 [Amyelois transitella]
MAVKLFCILACFVSCYGQPRAQQYIVPEAKLEAIYPKGLRVSIPDDGFSLFAFHGKLNEEMDGLEAGHWARDITKAKEGRWTFRDRNVKLKLGDKIYFWTYVIKDGLGYRQDNGEWTVTEFVNEDGTPADTSLEPTPAPINRPNQPNPPQTPRPDPPCAVSTTMVEGRKSVCQGTLLFSEEFEKPSLKELTNWEAEIKFPEEPDYPFNVYMDDGTLGVEEGNLVLTPRLLESHFHPGFLNEALDLTNRCSGQVDTTECRRQASGAQILPPVMTGKITTKNKFNFKFGRVEVRAKLPAGNWLIPEINLEPKDNVFGSKRYESGLMRVAFAKGNAVFAKKLNGGPVLSDTEPFRSLLMKEKIGIDNWNGDFHNYTMIWKKDGIDMLVDGEKYGSIDPGEGFYAVGREHAVPHAAHWLRGTVMAPLDQYFFISLGLRVGGVHDFADSPDKPWKNRSNKAVLNFWNSRDSWFPTWFDANLQVDYVRVYALCTVPYLNSVSFTLLLMNRDKTMLLLFVTCFSAVWCYEVPLAKLEAIYPKGLRVSIPDDGFSLFAFHGKLNEEMEGLEAGHWSRDITKVKDGRWIFRDREAKLKIGDKIYFWTFIIKNGLGYRQDNGEWTVTGYVDEEGNPVESDYVPVSTSSPALVMPEVAHVMSPTVVTAAPDIRFPCEISVSTVSSPGFVCKGQLLFEDNFNSKLEKSNIWSPEIMFPGEPDYPFNVYLNDNNLRVRDGKLIIRPITLESKFGEDYVRLSLDLTDRCTGTIGTMECSRAASGPQILPPVITAKVTTKKKFNFKYGRIEVGARMPLGDWLIPEIQLEPRDHVYGVHNYASGILRIATVRGNVELSKKLYGGPILCDTEPYRTANLREKISFDHWNKAIHNYSLEWRPDGISLFVDGDKYGDVSPGEGFYNDASKNNVAAASQWQKGTSIAPFDDLFYISIGLNVGGVHEYPDSPNKPWSNKATKAMLNFWNGRDQWLTTWHQDTSALQIDYVRVYAL